MRLYKTFTFIVLLIFVKATGAGAAHVQHYALVYAWDTEMQRLLAYRERLASLLELTIDRQLKMVGRGQEYGIVWNISGTPEQAKITAEKHNVKLRRAGLKPAQLTQKTSYQNLYHLRYGTGSNLPSLKKDYGHFKESLGGQAGDKLVIEKIDSRTWAIVYRCWQSKADTLRVAQHHAVLLKKKNVNLSLVPAMERPVVHGPSALPDTTQTMRARVAAPPPSSAPILQNSQQQAATACRLPASQRQKAQAQLKEQPPLPEAQAGLNSRMGAFLKEQTSKGTIQPRERTAWAAYDLTNNSYIVSINSHRPFQAASMIKPFVALAFFHQADRGKATYTAQHRHMMEAMIQHSSNSATNWFIRQLGGPAKCEALLKKEYGRLFSQVRIKEYIPADGRTYKNSAQPSDYIQFLRALWNYQLPNSKEMLRVMSLPGPDRLLYGTEVPRGTAVYNKTGTTAHLCGDMGILVARAKDGRKVPYALVGIVERPSKPADYKQWMHASGGAIRDFSELVYEEMKRKHDLL